MLTEACTLNVNSLSNITQQHANSSNQYYASHSEIRAVTSLYANQLRISANNPALDDRTDNLGSFLPGYIEGISALDFFNALDLELTEHMNRDIMAIQELEPHHIGNVDQADLRQFDDMRSGPVRALISVTFIIGPEWTFGLLFSANEVATIIARRRQ